MSVEIFNVHRYEGVDACLNQLLLHFKALVSFIVVSFVRTFYPLRLKFLKPTTQNLPEILVSL